MKLGARGERIAARTLKRAGYRLIARNYACPAGEIDIIAVDHDTVVFIEVKTRSSDRDADPEINVHRRKQSQIVRAARFYLAANKAAQDRPCRFDVLAVVVDMKRKPVVEHFVDAFQAPDRIG